MWSGNSTAQNNWHQDRELAHDTGIFTWRSTAQARSTGTSDGIAPGDWTDPVLDFSLLPRNTFATCYFYNWNGTSDPKDQSLNTTYGTGTADIRFNFDTKTLHLGSTNVNTGWTLDIPDHDDLPYIVATLEIKENAFEGTQTITAHKFGRSVWEKLPPVNIRIIKDDSNRTLRFAADNTSNFLGSTLSVTDLFNDSITETNVVNGLGYTPPKKDGSNLTANEKTTFRGAIGAGTSNFDGQYGCNKLYSYCRQYEFFSKNYIQKSFRGWNK